MYLDESIPVTFKYIAEISDNYIIVVNTATLYSGVEYEAYIQYLTPSLYVIHLDDYRIKTGDNYILDYNYLNNGVYSYVDTVDVDYSIHCNEIEEVNNDYYDRTDLPQIMITQFLLVFVYVWIINQVTKFVHKGGIFGG